MSSRDVKHGNKVRENSMEPLDLLKLEFEKYKKALKKSEESFLKREISKELHETHKGNLKPKIQEYRDAIETLIIFGR